MVILGQETLIPVLTLFNFPGVRVRLLSVITLGFQIWQPIFPPINLISVRLTINFIEGYKVGFNSVGLNMSDSFFSLILENKCWVIIRNAV